MEEPSYGGHTASFFPMNQSAYVGNQPMIHQGMGGQKLDFG